VLVGNLPPYEAIKLRYFVDDRFAPLANLPTPETPEEQRAELISCEVAWSQVLEPPAPPDAPAAPPVAAGATAAPDLWALGDTL